MDAYSNQINKLIEELSKLPGIGAKSAQRLAFHIINMPKDQVQNLAGTIVSAREKIRYCSCCWNLTDSELCPICANPKRDHHVIMLLRLREIWQLMRRRRSMKVSTMSCMGLSRRCLASVRRIFV